MLYPAELRERAGAGAQTLPVIAENKRFRQPFRGAARLCYNEKGRRQERAMTGIHQKNGRGSFVVFVTILAAALLCSVRPDYAADSSRPLPPGFRADYLTSPEYKKNIAWGQCYKSVFPAVDPLRQDVRQPGASYVWTEDHAKNMMTCMNGRGFAMDMTAVTAMTPRPGTVMLKEGDIAEDRARFNEEFAKMQALMDMVKKGKTQEAGEVVKGDKSAAAAAPAAGVPAGPVTYAPAPARTPPPGAERKENPVSPSVAPYTTQSPAGTQGGGPKPIWIPRQ